MNLFSPLNTEDRNEESVKASDVARETSSDRQDGSDNDEESGDSNQTSSVKILSMLHQPLIVSDKLNFQKIQP